MSTFCAKSARQKNKKQPGPFLSLEKMHTAGNKFRIYINNIKRSSLKLPQFHLEYVTPLIKAI